MAWVAVGRGGQTLIRTGSRLILARLLWPEAFGLFSLASIVIAGVQIACQLQIPSAVIQHRSATRNLLSTAHWSLVALGMVGTLLVLGLANPIAGVLGHAAVVPLLQVSALHLVLTGLASVPRASLVKDMAFKRLAIRRLTSEGLGAVVGLAVAIGGGGVWSLVIEELVADLVDLFLLWRMVTWRPLPHWSLSEFRELLGFGAPMLSRSGLDYFVDNGDRFLVGRLFGPETLGLFSVALRLVVVVTDTITNVFERVAFPAFARLRENLRQSQRGFLQAIRFQAALLFPLMIVVGVLANDLVPWLLGSQWAGAVAFTQILAVRGLLSSMLSLPRATLAGRGRPWVSVGLSLCGAALFAMSWTVGLHWGPLGIAAGGVVAAAVLVPISVRVLVSDLPFSPRAWVRALAPATMASALMAVVMLAGAWLVPGLPHLDRPVRLIMLVAAGTVCYLGVIVAWLWRDLHYYAQLVRHERETGKNAFEA